MNNLITNTYNNQSNLRTTNYNNTKASDYITDSYGNIYEVVTENEQGSLDKNDFLKILLTQMQLQDPLSPMDSTESISQMTSFSILEQLTQITEKIDSLGQILVQMNERLNSDTNTNTDTDSDSNNSNSDVSEKLLSRLKTVYS